MVYLILGLQPCYKTAMFGGQYNSIFSRRIYMKIEFSSQRREMHLFLTINMAAVTSRANQQFGEEKKLLAMTFTLSLGVN